MAFRAGWQTVNDEERNQIGDNIAFDCPDVSGDLRDVYKTSDEGWEAAKGKYKMTSANPLDRPCFTHMFAFEMVECDSVCWRIGVTHEDFPVTGMWDWFKTLAVDGDAPPWGILLSGGKSDVQVYPPSILKAGEVKLNKNYRNPRKVPPMKFNEVLDGVGRLKLRKGDIIGVHCNMGQKHGDCQVTFFINGVQIHETLHIHAAIGEKWVPYVCLANSQVRVKMLHPREAMWDIPEEHEFQKAEEAWKDGTVEFEGTGWMTRQMGVTKSWVRSWYQLGFEDLIFAKRPILFVKLHTATELEFAAGSVPQVVVHAGNNRVTDTEEKKRGLSLFGGGGDDWCVSATAGMCRWKNRGTPVWEETLELPLDELDGSVSFIVTQNKAQAHGVVEPEEPVKEEKKEIKKENSEKGNNDAGDGLMGTAYLDLRDIERASYKDSTLKKFQKKWLILTKQGQKLPTGKVLVSCSVGHPKETGGEAQAKSFLRSILGSAGSAKERDRLKIEWMTNVRKGAGEARLILIDYSPPGKGTSTLKLRVELQSTLKLCVEPERHDMLVEEERDAWVLALHAAVARRTMHTKARQRAVELLKAKEGEVIESLRAVPFELDPSEFSSFGFSRDKREWLKHPLKDVSATASKSFSFEFQWTDGDVLEVAKPLASNTWITSLRLDCYSSPGYIGDAGAEALAKALITNKCLTSLNLRGNRIGDLGCQHFAEMLCKNRTLQKLNLDGNRVSQKGAVKMIAAILGNPQRPSNDVILELNLQFNNLPQLEAGTVRNCRFTADI